MTDQDNDYLWDRSGPPRADIERLEALLAVYRHDAPPSFVHATPRGHAAPRRHALGRMAWPVAAAALLVLVAGGTWWFMRSVPGAVGVTVVAVDGTPHINAKPIEPDGRWPIGRWLETDTTSRARIEIAGFGHIALEPGSRVQLADGVPGRYRLHLQRGVLDALIAAPPGQFVVDTPSATAVDLGCAYTLEVDGRQTSLLRVTSGLVALSSRSGQLSSRSGHATRTATESFVPVGFGCASSAATDLCTPFRLDAAPEFKETIRALDLSTTADSRAPALAHLLDEADARDAVTVWHLVMRTESDTRARIVTKLAELVPPPAGVSPAAVVAGDPAMLDAWWTAFGYGPLELWRSIAVKVVR